MSAMPVWWRVAGVAALLSAMLWVSVAPATAEEDQVVAVVNGHVIGLADVYAQIESLPLGEQITYRERLERFIESVVQEEVLYQSMLATDFAAEPELRERVKNAVVQYLIERHVTARVSVSDADVLAFYELNEGAIRGEYVEVGQIVLGRREECEALRERVDSAATFRSLAEARSLDRASAERGGDLGRFMNHEGPYGFEEKLFEMRTGDLAVFDAPEGCRVVRVNARVTPPLPPLDEVEPRIRDLLRRQQEVTLLRGLIERSSHGLEIERRELH
jgi:parvulin-like peptidyl-prolyl isomerase